MNHSMLPLPGLSSASGKPACSNLRRPAVVGWRRSGVARSRTAASGRRLARRLHDRSSRGRSDHAQLGGRHPFSTADDQRWLRGRQRRQCAAPRSDVQDGAGSFAHRSGVVLAVDNIAVGEFAGRSRPAADGQGDGRSVLRVLRHGSQTDHAGHRRRSMRSTVVSSCGCSTPTTTNTDFSRSSCSTAKAASSPPCFVPPSGRAARRSSPS